MVGDRLHFTLENRIFNAVSIITLFFLFLFIPFNLVIGLPSISILLGATFVLQGFLFYLARFKKKFALAGGIYCFGSYLFLIINYYFNSGINGPTILAFLVSFILFIAITPARWHLVWIVLHILIIAALLILEYLNFGAHYSYTKQVDRVIDTAGTYAVLLICLYFVISYIRRNYNEERSLAEQHAASIAVQNAELAELNQEKSRLFSMISHDLRAPLNSIQGYLELLADGLLPEKDKIKIEAELLNSTRYTQDMLFNLLSWSKSQLSGSTVTLRPINLYTEILATVEMLQAVASQKGITLKNNIDPMARINADADMMQLVIRNLVHNAIKFTASGGGIVVKTVIKGNECHIYIKDTGAGIPVEKQQDIFSLKIRSAYGTKKEKGIGLGLYLCRQFIELQKGRIWFTSQPGVGSEFVLAFPVAEATV